MEINELEEFWKSPQETSITVILPSGALADGHSLLVYRNFLRTFSLYLVSLLLSLPVTYLILPLKDQLLPLNESSRVGAT
jgi:hypothetical protein